MQIFVKDYFKGKEITFALAVSPSTTVGDIKLLIRQVRGKRLPASRQIIFFSDQSLHDYKTLSDYNIQDGSSLHVILQLRGMISTFTTTDNSDPFNQFLFGLAPAPTHDEFYSNGDFMNFNLDEWDTYEFHQNRRDSYLSSSQKQLCINFLDHLFKIEEMKGTPVSDLKVKFEDQSVIEQLLCEYRTPGDTDHNSACVKSLIEYQDSDFSNGGCIAMRCTRGPVPGAIGWHFDGLYASNTVQLALNDDTEYEGGRLCYFTHEGGVEVLRRCAGDISKHSRSVLHAVTPLTSGTRYSLFVVDKTNGLGDNCVINPDQKLVEDILSIIQHEMRAAFTFESSIPFTDITVGGLIGAGTFKTVYKGTWTNRRDETVCIMELSGPTPLIELEIMRSIGTQPNLLRFFGCCVHLEKHYFVVEYAPYGSLRDHLMNIEEDGIKPVFALEIALQTCQAMEQLNSLGIIHRDLAARNILVFRYSNRSHHDILVKVCDFGLSRQSFSSNDYYYGEGFRLPVRWSSPEVLLRRKFSEKSDVWAFGVVMWEIFSLAIIPYFDMSSDAEVIRSVTSGTKLTPPDGCPPSVYDKLFVPCFETLPRNRPPFETLTRLVREVQEELLVEAAMKTNQETCCICLTNKAVNAIVPCGHRCICDSYECMKCVEPSTNATAFCPIDRTPVQSILKIY